MLDDILRAYIKGRMDVDSNEYERHQGPPVLRFTRKAFGSDRRMPLINLWRATHPASNW